MNKQDAARPRILRAWGAYLLALTAWVTAVIALGFTGFWFCASLSWTPSPLYYLLIWIRDYLPLVGAVAVLAGWAVISYFYLARPYRQLHAMLGAAEQLAHPSDQPIVLPAGMGETEAQLNLIRSQALRDAQAARESEQRKNDLVVYLAHDLKTPLTSVLGYLTLLRDEPDLPPDFRARYTGIALEKAQRLEDLINDFFDITRFNLTHLELELSDTDLKRMLEQLCSEFEPVLRQQKLRCELRLPDALRALCDRDKMARVFDNLLNNACHYAYPDSVLEVRGWEEAGMVILVFQNAGATIPPEKLSRMFEQFFRLDPSRGTRSGNAGLGLAIAKEIVEAHGGTITARSRDEHVTFTVRLPQSPPQENRKDFTTKS